MTRNGRRPSLWRHPDFMKLWAAETISQFGTQVSILALPLVAAVILQVPAFEFGLLTAIEYLPFILVSLPAGVWVDRLRRRPILIVADIGRGAALVSIPVAHVLGVLTIWQLYVVAFTVGCLTVFFDVAYQSYLPSLVERDEILEGNSKLEVSRSAAQIGGPGIAGLIIGAVTAPVAIVLDSISYLASGAFVWAIRRAEPPPETAAGETPGRRTSMRTEIGQGIRYVATNRYLRHIAATTAISNFFSNIAFAILILYLVREFALTAEAIGFAFTLGSVGFLLGAVLANRLGSRLGVGPTIILGTLIFGPSALPVALATTPEMAVPAVALAGFLGGLGGAIYNINQVSLRQAITPLRMQGRMNATMRFIVWGTIPIGAILGGILGGTIGLRETIWIGAVGGLTAFLPVLLSPVRHIGQMPEATDADVPSAGPPVGASEQPAIEARP